VTELLAEASGGNVEALNRLVPLVYDELRKIAHAQLRQERAGHTLNTTALVHEAYVKLVDQDRVEWRDRSHFYGVAAQAMRRILVNYAEARRAQKRGGGVEKVPLDESVVPLDDAQLDEVLALDQALNRLQEFNPRGARVVEYRFFAGLQHDEVAEIMEVSPITVRRAWGAARSWLRRELSEGAPGWTSRLSDGDGG
jgi:RNA polymerase sigma factor (TIGR02999 family)